MISKALQIHCVMIHFTSQVYVKAQSFTAYETTLCATAQKTFISHAGNIEMRYTGLK